MHCPCFVLEKSKQNDKITFGKPIESEHSKSCPLQSKAKQQQFAYLHNYLKQLSFENVSIAKRYKRNQYYQQYSLQFENGFNQAFGKGHQLCSFQDMKQKEKNKRLQQSEKCSYNKGSQSISQSRNSQVQKNNAVVREIFAILNGMIDLANNGIFMNKISLLRLFSQQKSQFSTPKLIRLTQKIKLYDSGTWQLASLYSNLAQENHDDNNGRFQILYLLDRAHNSIHKCSAITAGLKYFNQNFENKTKIAARQGSLVSMLLKKLQFQNPFYQRVAWALKFDNVDFLLFVEHLMDLLLANPRELIIDENIQFVQNFKSLYICQPNLSIIWQLLINDIFKQQQILENTSAKHFFMLLIEQLKKKKPDYWRRASFTHKLNDQRCQYSRYKRQKLMKNDFMILLQLLQAYQVFKNPKSPYQIKEKNQHERIKYLFKKKIQIQFYFIKSSYKLYQFELDDPKMKQLWEKLLENYKGKLKKLDSSQLL